jgi:plasmid stabilization system protein ParE
LLAARIQDRPAESVLCRSLFYRRRTLANEIKETVMPRGDKSKYTDKQKRKAEHIAEGYKDSGVGTREAKRRAWATVNKDSGGGELSGSGRGHPSSNEASRRGGRIGGAARRRKASSRSASSSGRRSTRSSGSSRSSSSSRSRGGRSRSRS